MATFRAFNRGIAVASVYALVLLLVVWFAMPFYIPAGARIALFGLCGFLAGTITGFSNTQHGESLRRDLRRNVSDGAMVSVWIAIVWLTLNLLQFGAPVNWVALRLGVFSAGALLGAAIGEPVLILLGSLSIRGRRPFAAANRFCDRFHDVNVRFVAQVILHTVAFVSLVAAAVAAAMVVMIVVAIILTFLLLGWLLSVALSDGNRRTSYSPSRSRRRYSSSDDEDAAPAFRLRAGQRIDEQGRVVDTHWYGDVPAGQNINEKGQIVNERWIGDEPTGYRIAEDGRLQREGLLFDQDVGVSLVSDGHGGQRVVRPGVFSDEDTGLRVDAEGRAIQEGVFFDREQGFEIDGDGNVRKI